MRTGLVTAMAVILAVLIGAWCAETDVRRVTQVYVSAAEELRVMAEEGAWARAEETLRAYAGRWEKEQKRLKCYVKHAVVQEMTMAMERLMIGLAARDASLCALSCTEWRQQAELLREQETFSWTNLM